MNYSKLNIFLAILLSVMSAHLMYRTYYLNQEQERKIEEIEKILKALERSEYM
jgi:hypothetical protein